jgi:hypothetical protein
MALGDFGFNPALEGGPVPGSPGGIGGILPGLSGIGSGLATALRGGSATESVGSGLGAAIGSVAFGPIGGIIGSTLGGFAGGLFGGGKGHPTSFTGLEIPERLSGLGIVSTPVSRGSYEHAGESSATITDSIHNAYNKVVKEFNDAGFNIPTELTDITKLPHYIAAVGVPDQGLSPEQAFQERQNMNQASVNIFSRSLSILDELKSGNKEFTALYNSNPSIDSLMTEFAKGAVPAGTTDGRVSIQDFFNNLSDTDKSSALELELAGGGTINDYLQSSEYENLGRVGREELFGQPIGGLIDFLTPESQIQLNGLLSNSETPPTGETSPPEEGKRGAKAALMAGLLGGIIPRLLPDFGNRPSMNLDFGDPTGFASIQSRMPDLENIPLNVPNFNFTGTQQGGGINEIFNSIMKPATQSQLPTPSLASRPAPDFVPGTGNVFSARQKPIKGLAFLV